MKYITLSFVYFFICLKSFGYYEIIDSEVFIYDTLRILINNEPVKYTADFNKRPELATDYYLLTESNGLYFEYIPELVGTDTAIIVVKQNDIIQYALEYRIKIITTTGHTENYQKTINEGEIFSFSEEQVHFECGMTYYEHPLHSEYDSLWFNYDSAIYHYVYKPEEGYIGKDTFKIIKGCLGYPVQNYDTIAYCLEITGITDLKYYPENNEYKIYYVDENIVIYSNNNIIKNITITTIDGRILHNISVNEKRAIIDINYRGICIIGIHDQNNYSYYKKTIL